jgi:hypothetical protein
MGWQISANAYIDEMTEMKHKTKHIEWNNWEAEVDCKIADLVLNLWKLDLFTYLSCENNVPKNYVWIQFIDAFSAERFLDIVANEWQEESEHDSLYWRVRAEQGYTDLKYWKFDACLDDLNTHLEVDENDEYAWEVSTGKPQFNFAMSVRFPQSDLKVVEKAVAEAVKGLEAKQAIFVANNKD